MTEPNDRERVEADGGVDGARIDADAATGITETFRRTVDRTVAALRVALARRDSKAVLLLGTLGYLLVYLFTVGDLGTSLVSQQTVTVVDDLGRAFVSTGFLRFDAIAVVSGFGVVYLFSPLNLALALVLGLLVGANLALTYLGLVQPRACGLEASTGVAAGVPALLSGAACCGPTILLVVGVQASAAWIAAFQFLVPLALVMLVGGLLLIGRQVDPALL